MYIESYINIIFTSYITWCPKLLILGAPKTARALLLAGAIRRADPIVGGAQPHLTACGTMNQRPKYQYTYHLKKKKKGEKIINDFKNIPKKTGGVFCQVEIVVEFGVEGNIWKE